MQVAVELVVAPASIDITVADIGGLDEIVDKLVSYIVKNGCWSFLIVHASVGMCCKQVAVWSLTCQFSV